jgi:esterase/lipase superfamily enzyme
VGQQLTIFSARACHGAGAWPICRAVIALMTTTDPIKLLAAQALLAGEEVACDVFDGQAGSLWRAIIPLRLMVGDDDVIRAKRILRQAGFVEAGDGDWDLR